MSAKFTEIVSLFLKEEGEIMAFFNAPTVVIVKVMTPCEL